MKKLFTEKQVAALLEVSVKTLQGWRLKGGGPPFVKMGRLVRYLESDVEAFVLEKSRTSTSDRGRTPVLSPPPCFTVRPVPAHESRFDRPRAAACPPPTTPRLKPAQLARLPTRRLHATLRCRIRTRPVVTNQSLDGPKLR